MLLHAIVMSGFIYCSRIIIDTIAWKVLVELCAYFKMSHKFIFQFVFIFKKNYNFVTFKIVKFTTLESSFFENFHTWFCILKVYLVISIEDKGLFNYLIKSETYLQKCNRFSRGGNPAHCSRVNSCSAWTKFKIKSLVY